MEPQLALFLETSALLIQYFGVGVLCTAFTELIKDPIKESLPEHHGKFLALLSGIAGLILQGVAWGFTSEILVEGFVIGVGASGAYRVATGMVKLANPAKAPSVQIQTQTLTESKPE